MNPWPTTWSAALTTAALLLAALIHLLPLPGLLGAGTLQTLYGLPAPDPASELLLRHRAWMFGLFGLALVLAVWRPEWRNPAVSLVLLSDLGFLLLALIPTSSLNAALQRVLIFDLVSIALLVVVLLLNHGAARLP